MSVHRQVVYVSIGSQIFEYPHITYGYCEPSNRPTSAESRAVEWLHCPESDQEVGEHVNLTLSGFDSEAVILLLSVHHTRPRNVDARTTGNLPLWTYVGGCCFPAWVTCLYRSSLVGDMCLCLLPLASTCDVSSHRSASCD